MSTTFMFRIIISILFASLVLGVGTVPALAQETLFDDEISPLAQALDNEMSPLFRGTFLVSFLILLTPIILGIIALHDIRKQNLAGKKRAIFAIIAGTFSLLVLIGIGISNSGGGGGRVDSDLAPGLVRLELVANAFVDFVDAHQRRNGADMQNARLRFGVVNLAGLSSEYQSAHEALRKEMIAVEFSISGSPTRTFIDRMNAHQRAFERETARLQSGRR